MLIATDSTNLCAASATSHLTPANEFELGSDRELVTDTDLLKKARGRGRFTVVLGESDSVEFDDGVARSVTMTAAVFNSPGELCKQVAADMNTVSTNWQAYLRQDTSADERFHFEVFRSSGTGNLTIAADTDSVFRELMGYADQDTAVGATHTGDFVAMHGPKDGFEVAFDLGSSLAVTHAFVAGMNAGAACRVRVALGAADPPVDDETYAGDRFTAEQMMIPVITGGIYRYLTFNMYNPHCMGGGGGLAGAVPRGRLGLGYCWAGRPWDSDDAALERPVDWSIGSYGRRLEARSTVHRTKQGHAVLGATRPGESFAVTFGGAGLGAEYQHVEALLRSLGNNGYCFVNLDTNEPHRETRFCRVVGSPIQQLPIESGHGRWSVGLQFRVVDQW